MFLKELASGKRSRRNDDMVLHEIVLRIFLDISRQNMSVRVWTDLDGFGRIRTDLDGFGRIWTDLDGTIPYEDATKITKNTYAKGQKRLPIFSI